ncbi:MAG: FAD-dependent oxidoreductase [Clostridiales bacterium]|nr:FAD-dependent oxidoreductase [Clostridiales bacterium]
MAEIFNTDIVVIAAGPAGLAAAISATEEGARVVVLEKTNTTGGTANMGMGPMAVETRQQREKLCGLTREKAFYEFMNYTHWRSDALLVKKYIDKSADTIEWLEDMGVEFVEPSKFYDDSEPTWHYVKPDVGEPGPRAAATMMKRMTERAQEMDIPILLETWATDIQMEDGRVTGVHATNRDGENLLFECKAAIIATGGFASNHEWMKKYTGYTYGKDIFSFEGTNLTGDGIRMAWACGAAPTEMHMELNYRIPENMGHFAIDAVMRQPNLMVNKLGERFYNEGMLGNGTFAANAIDMQKDKQAFIIMDDSIKKYYRRNGLDLISIVHGTSIMEQFEDDVQAALSEGYEHFFVADSIEDLASQIEVPYNTLAETIEQYNADCAGRDTLFGKDYRYMKPLVGPKFYCARFCVAAYGTLGGIKINHRTEVIRKDYTPICGLYAAGTDACSIYGDSYVFLLPGNTMGFALNSGRMAGENASDYVLSDE